MLCPSCHALMLEGRVEMHPRRLGAGRRMHDADLHFTDAAGEALYPKLGHQGYRCRACDTVVIVGEAGGGELECFECKSVIPPEADRCPVCGWSWK